METLSKMKADLESNGDAKFVGSATVMEAKHKIYKECLGFENFKNYDGIRFGYKGVPTII